MSDERKRAGDRGEAEVARYLRKKGYTLLASQWRCRFGELDLVARSRRGEICFVEVKLRSEGAIALPREFVDQRKQDRIRTTAGIYLSDFPTPLQPRFDVIEIYAPQGTETPNPEINHLEDAFQ